MRTHKECNVEISGLAPRRFPSSCEARVFISRAALLVKVTARMRVGDLPCAISSRIRCVTTRVFPEPAPASTNMGPASVWTALSCSGFSDTRDEVLVDRGWTSQCAGDEVALLFASGSGVNKRLDHNAVPRPTLALSSALIADSFSPGGAHQRARAESSP